MGATCQLAARRDVAVGVTEGGLAVITSASTWKRRTNRQSSFDPTCRLVSSPKVGPGATVSTLKQGYPLLQYEGTVPARLSLVAWQTTPDPTMWTAPGPPRGRRRRYTPGYQRWVLELALLGKLIQRGSESNVNKVLTRDGNSSVNLASQGHCAGVFIGA
jgi:hypothetical protein